MKLFRGKFTLIIIIAIAITSLSFTLPAFAEEEKKEEGISFDFIGKVEFQYSDNLRLQKCERIYSGPATDPTGHEDICGYNDSTPDMIIKPTLGFEFKAPFSVGSFETKYLGTYNLFINQSDGVADHASATGQLDDTRFRQDASLAFNVEMAKGFRFNIVDFLVTSPVDLKSRADLYPNQTQINTAGAGLGWAYFWTEKFRTNIRFDYSYTMAFDPGFKSMDSMAGTARFDLGGKLLEEFLMFGGYQAVYTDYIQQGQQSLIRHEPMLGTILGYPESIVGKIELGPSMMSYPDSDDPGKMFIGARVALSLNIFYYKKNTLTFTAQSSATPNPPVFASTTTDTVETTVEPKDTLNWVNTFGMNFKITFYPRLTIGLDANVKLFGPIVAGGDANLNIGAGGGLWFGWEFYKSMYLKFGGNSYQYMDAVASDNNFSSNLAFLKIDVQY